MRKNVVAGIKEAAKWIPVVLLLLIFVRQGLAKFSDDSGWAIAFRHWGYPDWLRMTVGSMELAGCACLLWPRIAPLGAILILIVMLGAEGTHIAYDGARHMTSEIVPLVLATTVLLVRRTEMRRLLRVGKSR